ncbi:MAG: c-type cytochrome [Bacteroidota bacterium]
MKNKNIIRFLIAGATGCVLSASIISCGKADPNSPGNEFAPDMYRSPSLEAYQKIITTDGDTILSARQPANGSISRGNLPGLPPTCTYEQSASIKNPLPELNTKFSKYSDEGKEIYEKYCVHCHGATGAGDGKVSAKLPGPPPAYNGALKDLPEGKAFYSITKGKGLMGSHASQLSVEERWKVVCYVQTLQGPKDTAAAAPVDSLKAGKQKKTNKPK